MNATIAIVEKTFASYSLGETLCPAKVGIDLGVLGRKADTGGRCMPAYVGVNNSFGMKWICSNFDNPVKHNTRSHTAIIVLNDPDTLAPICVMEGSLVTAMRTGATTAVGCKHLAREGSHNVGVIGSGFQARYQILALAEVLDIARLYITDVRKELATKLSEEMRNKLSLDVKALESPMEVVANSDTIVTVTSSEETLVRKNDLKRGSLICALTDRSNLEYRVIKTADKIIVDHYEQTKRIGELAKWYQANLITQANIYAEIGDIVAGKSKWRQTEDVDIIFVPIGMASLDIAVAYEIYRLAINKDLGKMMPLFED